jgi:PAS domain-containing protein
VNVIHKEQQGKPAKCNPRPLFSPLRQDSGGQTMHSQAEEKAREKAVLSPENLQALSIEEIRRILHELRVHQIELEMQNEEMRRNQVELDAVRARYFDLYDLAPVGYSTISEKGLILESNLTCATLLGVARAALVKQPDHPLYPQRGPGRLLPAFQSTL